MTLTAFLFPILCTLKTSLDKCLKGSVWEDPSRSNMVNVPKHGLNLHHMVFIIFIDHCQVNWVRKSLLFTCHILGLLVNTLAADEKYPVPNRDNLTIPIQMQLSRKKKTFFLFYPAFLKSSWNSEHLERKMTITAFVFSTLWTPKT